MGEEGAIMMSSNPSWDGKVDCQLGMSPDEHQQRDHLGYVWGSGDVRLTTYTWGRGMRKGVMYSNMHGLWTMGEGQTK